MTLETKVKVKMAYHAVVHVITDICDGPFQWRIAGGPLVARYCVLAKYSHYYKYNYYSRIAYMHVDNKIFNMLCKKAL